MNSHVSDIFLTEMVYPSLRYKEKFRIFQLNLKKIIQWKKKREKYQKLRDFSKCRENRKLFQIMNIRKWKGKREKKMSDIFCPYY